MNIFFRFTTNLKRLSIPVLFCFTIVLIVYLLCQKIGSLAFFQSLLSKMGFSLGSRVLLSRGLGCEGWLLLVLILAAFGIFDGTIMGMTGGNETVNQGHHRGDAGPSSIKNSESDSGSWRKYLNFSSDNEEKLRPNHPQATPRVTIPLYKSFLVTIRLSKLIRSFLRTTPQWPM